MADSLRYGPPSAATALLCVDMQNLFAEDTPWRTPWMERVRPVVAELARYSAHATIFTRSIPPNRPEDVPGGWCRYFERWRELTRQNMTPSFLSWCRSCGI
jgi:nicotinamidase-related amidase